MDSGVPVPRVTKASELGCALNVDPVTGAGLGGPPTDDTALLNAFLATASAAQPVVLVMDGVALITGLRLSAAGYTTIQGGGEMTGFFIAQGANNDGIHNRPTGYVNDPGPPVPARLARQVRLLNFRLNGNRGDGHTGNSTSGDTHGAPWLFGINLMNMEDVLIDGVTVLHASTYGIRLSNVGHATIMRCRLAAFLPAEPMHLTNTDGIHVNGPANDIVIRDCSFRTGDDSIALNAPEGHGGDIVRVMVTDCHVDGSYSMMRIYSGSRTAAVVADVTVSGLSGVADAFCFIFGVEDEAVLLTKGALRNIVIRDSRVTGTIFANLQDNVRDLLFENVVWDGSETANGMITTTHHAIDIGLLTLKGCTIVRTADAHRAVCAVDLRGPRPVTMGTLVIDGLRCTGTGFPLEALVLLGSVSTVAEVDVKAVDAREIPRLVPDAQWPQVGRVTGAGLAGSGWAVPDAKMAEGVVYVSDETQLAAVVVNGTAHTLLRGIQAAEERG